MKALLLLAALAFGKVRFDGHKVYRLSLTEEQRTSYAWLRQNSHAWGLDFWNDNDVSVAPKFEQRLLNYFAENNITSTLYVENVQALIDREERHSLSESRYSGVPDISFFKDYRKLEEINSFMDDIVATYPKIAKKIKIGLSYENRTIYGVSLTGAALANNAPKPGIFYEGGIHAREWIAHATVSYILFTLASQYGKDSKITHLVDSFDWSFAPVVNPDGYVYTWNGDRMWRKTRKPNKGSVCIGTDPNRNWESHWCEAGASTQPCNDAYCGTKAFSEVETKSIADYVCAAKNIKLFIDFHAYSQFWMRPYGYTSSGTADAKDQGAAGQAAVAAIKATHGKVYTEGTIYNVVYPASGSSADYVYDTCKVKYAYGVELRDTGAHGFNLPASEIIPSGEEIFAATQVLADYVLAH